MRLGSWWILATTVTVAACGGGTAPPPGPGTISGAAPDLRGRRIMVLPVQENLGVRGNPDAELAFGLGERDVAVEWILPDELEAALARSPGLGASLRGLPVSQFLDAEVRRVGDPLFGDILRISSLVDADAALLPVRVALQAEPGSDPSVVFWTALIEARTGRVLWFSVLGGQGFPSGDPRGLASAVDVLARALLWYAGA